MNAAEENAARLLADAELLLNAGRYPTACSLATLSLEEAGKIWTLRRIATCNDDAERRAVWTQYRSHQTKGRHSIIRKVFARHACLRDELSGAADSRTEGSGTIDMVKQLGFYTDCVGDATWTSAGSRARPSTTSWARAQSWKGKPRRASDLGRAVDIAGGASFSFKMQKSGYDAADAKPDLPHPEPVEGRTVGMQAPCRTSKPAQLPCVLRQAQDEVNETCMAT